jgi:flagellar hook-length control protein FliK
MQVFAEMAGASVPESVVAAEPAAGPTAGDDALTGTEALAKSDKRSDSGADASAADEAAALSIAALLPGMYALAPPATGAGATPGTARDDLVSGAGTAGKGSSDAAALLMDVTQAALDVVSRALADATGSKSAIPVDSSAAATTASSQSASAASHMHALLASHSAGPADSAPRDLHAAVGTPAWTEELGSQLTWMASHGNESASLRLSPEHLGPLDIRISVRDGEASVWFGASNPDTRGALEQSLPRLRELFASQGLVLADAGVFQNAPRNQQNPAAFDGARGGPSAVGVESSVTRIAIAHAGFIDTYV